jgi:hypothetical protein
MPQGINLPVRGLRIDPNLIMEGSSGRGGLIRADEVIFEKPGTAQSRPAFRSQTTKVTDYRPVAMHSFNGSMVMSSLDVSSGIDFRMESPVATFTGDQAPADPNISMMQFMEARKALYFGTDVGVRKLLPSGTVVQKPGAWLMPWQLFGFGLAGGSLGDAALGFRAAYRICVVKRDSNDYIRRSAPMPRLDYKKSSAGVAYGISGRVYLNNDIEASDIIEIYRTKTVVPETTTPSEEYYLCLTFVVTTADVAAGYIPTFYDDVADDNLGAALYVNPGQEGEESSNEVPPLAVTLAHYESCAWYGNTKHRHRLNNSFVNNPTTAMIATQTKAGCVLTLGSYDITNVPTSTNIRVGQAVCTFTAGTGLPGDGYWGEGNAYLSPDTLVTAISGAGPYTVTMDKPALANRNPAAVSFVDVVTINRAGTATNFYWSDSVPLPALGTTGFNLRVFGGDSAATYAEKMAANSYSFAYVVAAYFWGNESTFKVVSPSFNTSSVVFGSQGDTGRFYLESTDFGSVEFSLTSNLGDYFKTPVSRTIGQESDEAFRPNRVYFSKPYEPEAVPLLNFVELGSQAAPIQQMVATGAALYVFKRDGLYRISGQAPASWRVDLVSPDVRLLYGKAACVAGGTVYAWTDAGAVAITGMNVENISDGRISTVLRKYNGYITAAPVDESYDYGVWVEYWASKNTILFGYTSATHALADTTDSDPAGAVYAFSLGTGEWSKWTCNLRCAAYDNITKEMYVAYRRSNLWDIRSSYGEYSGHDYASALAGTQVGLTGATFTLAQRGYWYPKVGDWVTTKTGTDIYRRVETVTGSHSGDITVGWANNPLPTGTVAASYGVYETIETRLQWPTNGLIGKSGLSREMTVQATHKVHSGRGVYRICAGAASEHLSTPSTSEKYEGAYTSGGSVSNVDRIAFNRAVARSTHLYPYLEMGEPSGKWEVHGITIMFEPSSEKFKR